MQETGRDGRCRGDVRNFLLSYPLDTIYQVRRRLDKILLESPLLEHKVILRGGLPRKCNGAGMHRLLHRKGVQQYSRGTVGAELDTKSVSDLVHRKWLE